MKTLLFKIIAIFGVLVFSLYSTSSAIDFKTENDRRAWVCDYIGVMFSSAIESRNMGWPGATIEESLKGYKKKYYPEITSEFIQEVVDLIMTDSRFVFAGGPALASQMTGLCMQQKIPGFFFRNDVDLKANSTRKLSRKEGCYYMAATSERIDIWKKINLPLYRAKDRIEDAVIDSGEGENQIPSWHSLVDDVYSGKTSGMKFGRGLRSKCDSMKN